MNYLIVCSVALLVSGLTFFSGFGLGTMLMPAFALFFPIPVAVAATALVHLANNIFKLVLIGKKTVWNIVFRFAIPAALAAMLGAALLITFEKLPPISQYVFGEQSFEITPVKLIAGIIIMIFALIDLFPKIGNFSFDKKYISVGGALSGFFGGLTGNQGALRSAFLIKAGLNKEEFIATGVSSSVIVDVARLLIYGITFYAVRFSTIGDDIWGLVVAATLSAFVGAFIGKQLLEKVTLRNVQILVGILLIIIGFGLSIGIL